MRNASVILVGTHLDLVKKEYLTDLRALVKKRYAYVAPFVTLYVVCFVTQLGLFHGMILNLLDCREFLIH